MPHSLNIQLFQAVFSDSWVVLWTDSQSRIRSQSDRKASICMHCV